MRKGYIESQKKGKGSKLLRIIICISLAIIILGMIYYLFFIGMFNDENNEKTSSSQGNTSNNTSIYASSDDKGDDDISKQISTMSLEEKIGQMMIITFRKDASDKNVTAIGDNEKKVLEDIKPGGIILFGTNIANVEQIRKYIADVQSIGKIPSFISVDQEGGGVQRITNTEGVGATKIPSMLSIGDKKDISLTLSIGKVIGSELGVFGFNMDYAPDTDVFSNPENTVIGDRAFGKTPDIVAQMAPILAKGLKDENIIPVFKHFPGHGDTTADTHKGSVTLDKSIEELERTELIPFKRVIEDGADCIMVAHIKLPKIDSTGTPASLSNEVVTNLLRKKLGFNGIVMTDGLDTMKAIIDNYSDSEVGVMAIKAGVDIILLPRDAYKAKQGILEAITKGEISEERINESVERILKLKKKYNLTKTPKLNDISILGSKEHQDIVNKVK